MYTKGPWKQAKDDKIFIYALNDKGYNRFWFRLQSNTHLEHEASQEELEANADLIAASPELLEALELAHEHMKLHIYNYNEGWNVYEQVRGAIAKAKGLNNV